MAVSSGVHAGTRQVVDPELMPEFEHFRLRFDATVRAQAQSGPSEFSEDLEDELVRSGWHEATLDGHDTTMPYATAHKDSSSDYMQCFVFACGGTRRALGPTLLV